MLRLRKAPRKWGAVQVATPSGKGDSSSSKRRSHLKRLRGTCPPPGSLLPWGAEVKGPLQGPNLKSPTGMVFRVPTWTFPRWVCEHVIIRWATDALPLSRPQWSRGTQEHVCDLRGKFHKAAEFEFCFNSVELTTPDALTFLTQLPSLLPSWRPKRLSLPRPSLVLKSKG